MTSDGSLDVQAGHNKLRDARRQPERKIAIPLNSKSQRVAVTLTQGAKPAFWIPLMEA